MEKLSAKDKVIWFNMRQEPVAYIGGLPVALRKPDNPHTNIEVSDKELDAMEASVNQSEQTLPQSLLL